MRQSKFFNLEPVPLTSSSWSHCEGLIKAFEEAWRRGPAPAIADYLRTDGPERRALLVELIHVDLEFRLKSGESARVETYLADYPELAADRAAILGLVAAEYEGRRLHQSAVSLDEYGQRFPDYRDELPECLRSVERDTQVYSGRAAPAGPPGWPAVPGYEIVCEIGRGGMGIVYKANELGLGRPVALKFLPPEYVRDPNRLGRFLREARTASALNHPHICTVYALGEHEGRPFIALEFIEGLTLTVLAARRPGVEEAARLLGQAARALAAAHAAGVVHRDIKPENIMVRADGIVKVLDFGLARRLPTFAHADPGGGQDTDPGALLGTAAYMSPEQTRGTAVDSASDVFSLGIVLYQLATGQHPFQTDTTVGMLHAIATRQPVAPSRLNPEIPASLEGLIGAMLHKDPRVRPTAAEVEASLATLADRVPGGAVRDSAARRIVRRESELAALRAALAQADAGRGSLVCVTGEPGIGKTTLVEDFLDELAASGRACLVARGHCSERLAGTEAYLPVIDALGNLLRDDGSGSAARLLKMTAPTWYAEVAPSAGDSLAPDSAPSSRALSQQAMLREFGSFLREASRLAPIVLFFDDVHWADLSTVDLLAHLGSHFQGERVLVVVTYRVTELLLGPHPFHRVKLELQGKRICTELALGFLHREGIDRYLALAFPGHAFPADFADLIHSRTEGSPLFMVDLLRYLRERGVIAESGGRWVLARELPDLRQELPESVRGIVRRKLERLDEEERRLLAAASVQGQEFDSAVVAGALERDVAEVEERLQVLDQVHGFIRQVGEYEFPDHTLTLRYAFVHLLYQQALYADLLPTRRVALSAALARTVESHHSGNPAVAAELACLYEVGRDFGRAARQFGLAARNAARVFAHREAVALARRGLSLVTALPETPERAALELPLQTTLGLQLQVTEGYASSEASQAYHRARALGPQAPDAASAFSVLWGLWLFHKVRSELATAQQMADELLALAGKLSDPDLALQAHQALGMTALCRGEPVAALSQVEQVTALYDPVRHRTHAFLFGQDPGVIAKAYGALALWLLGYPDTAERHSDAAIQMSRDLSPTSQAVALHLAAMLHPLRRDSLRTRACARATAAIAAEHRFSFWLAGAAVMSGWALAASTPGDEGIDQLRRGLRDWQQTGSITYRTYYLGLLAEVLGGRGQVEEGGRVLEEALALARQTGEGMYEAELYRLRGELRLGGTEEPAATARVRAEEDFRQALEVARRQGARSLVLRAAMSLTGLSRDSATAVAARDILAETYAGFTEGLQTPDLQEARALLESVT